MKCEEVEIKMVDYLDNNLNDAVRDEIEKHLCTCERCLDELKDCQEILQVMSKAEMVKPSDSLRINFNHMLHSEIKKSKLADKKDIRIHPNRWYRSAGFSIAAGVALLICGTFLGMFLHSGFIKEKNSSEFALLQSEVNALKKAALFTMLNEQSSSDRIQAVNYVDDLENADEPVLEVLVRTLNTDKNVNVRMAAAYALAKFADQRSVVDSLVASLPRQNDPIVQVTLINILVERREQSAIMPIQKIINDKSTLIEVKQVAEKGVKMLI
jgi:hypothetical protein